MAINPYDKLVPFQTPESYIPQSPDFAFLARSIDAKQKSFDTSTLTIDKTMDNILGLKPGLRTSSQLEEVQSKYTPKLKAIQESLILNGNSSAAMRELGALKKEYEGDVNVKTLTEDHSYLSQAREAYNNQKMGYNNFTTPDGSVKQLPLNESLAGDISGYYQSKDLPPESFNSWVGKEAKVVFPEKGETPTKEGDFFLTMVDGKEQWMQTMSNGSYERMTESHLREKVINSGFLKRLYENKDTQNVIYWSGSQKNSGLPDSYEEFEKQAMEVLVAGTYNYKKTNESTKNLGGTEASPTEPVRSGASEDNIPYEPDDKTSLPDRIETATDEADEFLRNNGKNSEEYLSAHGRLQELQFEQQQKKTNINETHSGLSDKLDKLQELLAGDNKEVAHKVLSELGFDSWDEKKAIEGILGLEDKASEMMLFGPGQLTGGVDLAMGLEEAIKQLKGGLTGVWVNTPVNTGVGSNQAEMRSVPGLVWKEDETEDNKSIQEKIEKYKKAGTAFKEMKKTRDVYKEQVDNLLEENDALSLDVWKIVETPENTKEFGIMQSNFKEWNPSQYYFENNPLKGLREEDELALKGILQEFGSLYSINKEGGATLSLRLTQEQIKTYKKLGGSHEMIANFMENKGKGGTVFFPIDSDPGNNSGLYAPNSSLRKSIEGIYGIDYIEEAYKGRRMKEFKIGIGTTDMGRYSPKLSGWNVDGSEKMGFSVKRPTGEALTYKDVLESVMWSPEGRYEYGEVLQGILSETFLPSEDIEKIVNDYIEEGLLPSLPILDNSALGGNSHNPVDDPSYSPMNNKGEKNPVGHRLPKEVMLDAAETINYNNTLVPIGGLKNVQVTNQSKENLVKGSMLQSLKSLERYNYTLLVNGTTRSADHPEYTGSGSNHDGNAVDANVQKHQEFLFLQSLENNSRLELYKNMESIKDKWINIADSEIKFIYHKNSKGEGFHLHMEPKNLPQVGK